MDNVGAGAGGGIHPGAPIIWPNIKPTTTTETTETTQSKTQSTQTTTSSSSATSAASTASSSSVMRSLSSQDLSAQLVSMGMADSVENQSLAMKMLEHGLELSQENFEQLFSALQSKGNSQSAQQAAFTALAKGVANNQTALNVLDNFFSGQMNAAQQAENLSQQLQNVAQNLAQSPNVLADSLTSGVSSLISELDSRLKQMSNKDNFLSKENIALSASQKDSLSKLVNNATGVQQNALNSALNKNSPLSQTQQEALQQMLRGSVGMTDDQTKAMQDLLLSKNILPDNIKNVLSQMLQKESGMPAPYQDALSGLFRSAPSLSNEQRQFLSQMLDSASVTPEQKMLLGDVMSGNYSSENLSSLEKMVSESSLSMDHKLSLNNVLHSLVSPKTDVSLANASNVLPTMSQDNLQLLSQMIASKEGFSNEQVDALMNLLSGVGLMNGEHVHTLQQLINNGGLYSSQNQALQMLLEQPGLLSSADLSILQEMLGTGQLNDAQLFALQQLLMQLQNKPIEMPISWAQDFNAMQAFIKGIYKQLSNQKLDDNGKMLLESLKALEKSLAESVSNMTAQGILSKMSKYNDPALPDRYYYWMIPNPFSEKKRDIEILVKRDTNKDGAPINPNRTQIILKTETDTMGDVAVIVEISGKDVWYLFNTDNDDARKYIAANSAMLREQMKVLDFNVQGFQTQIKKVNINKILSPTLDLDRLRRVSAEA